MSVTQTVDIPASHRLTIDVPREIPAGPTVLVFKPVGTGTKELIDPGPPPTGEEAEDVLADQDLDALFESLEQLTPQQLEIMRDTIVPISLADLVNDRDDAQPNVHPKGADF